MYRIGICDDNVTVCAEIEKYLLEYASTENFEDIEIEVFLSGKDLCRVIRNDSNVFQLIFLDIELGDMDGISVGNILREEMKNEVTQVVFISYTQEYAMQLFKIRPMDFLIKPITYNKIYDIMQIYRTLFTEKKMFLEYRKGRNSYQIAQNEIICIKCEGKKIRIVTNKEEVEFYGKMADVSKQLDPAKFWTIHKSFIINVDYVFSFGKDEIKMVSGDSLPVSKSYKKDITNKILRLRSLKREREAK